MAQSRIPVLIAGAGPAGLALAIELAGRGVRSVIVERNDRVGHAPRAKTTHTRTREHLRRWGIAGTLAEASPFGVDYPSNIVFCTRLAGPLLTRIEDAFNCAPARNELYSEHAQWVPQYILEDVLRRHAESLPGVDIRFNCELQACHQDQDHVTSSIRHLGTGAVSEILSDYVVGADGARSTVREIIGARMEGAYGLSRNYNIVFRAPGLAEAHAHGPAVMYWQVNSDVPSLIGPMDVDDRWFFMPTGVSDKVVLSNGEAADLIRAATGIDLPYEVLSTDEWVASRFLADKYREGRIFLVGDACHLHPPFGGYGMNMGISDSVDLGWKLAALVRGWGGETLLDSYEAERKPVHQEVIDEAVANHALLGAQLWQEGLEANSPAGEALRIAVGDRIADAKRREFKSLGVVLGYRYATSPIIAHEIAKVPAASPDHAPGDPRPYLPSAEPGCLAPHAWLDDGRSLYDLFGPDFTLLVTGDGAAGEAEKAERDALATGVPLTIVAPVHTGLERLYGAPLALIRPDQHVAWRGEVWPGSWILNMAAGRSASLAPVVADGTPDIPEIDHAIH